MSLRILTQIFARKDTRTPPARLARMLPYGLALLVLLVSVGAQLEEPQLFSALRNLVFDRYLLWRPRDYQPLPVRIIDIDDASLKQIGQWPWPRTELARLLERLAKGGPAVIAMDIVLSGPDSSSPQHSLRAWNEDPDVSRLLKRLPDHDAILAETISRAPVITAFMLTKEPDGGGEPALKAGFGFAGERPLTPFMDWSGSLRALDIFEAHAEGNGALNVTIDSDGRVRKTWLFVPGTESFYPGLAAEALRVAMRQSSYTIRTPKHDPDQNIKPQMLVRIGELTFPVEHDGAFRVHLSEPVPERYIPAWKVLEGQVPDALIRGHIVFVGSSAAILKDLYINALGKITPGVELHAQTVEQILQGITLTRPDWALSAEVMAQLLIALVVAAILAQLGAVWAALTGIIGVVGIFAASYRSFVDHGLLLDPLTPSLTLILVYLMITAYRHFQTERQRRWIENAFSSYVSPNLVRHLVRHPEQLKLGGEKRLCSFIFTDVAGFTSIVESTEPEELVAILNEYLEGMVSTVFAHDGTVDRIVGDAVAVIFSAPLEQADHAQRAVNCALALDRFAQAFVERKQREGRPFGLTRIGVHSGAVIIGNFGGRSQLDYRAFGDPINTCARLESVNKHLGTRVCVSGATVANCLDFRGRPIGTLVLKGKTRGVPAFEPLLESDCDSVRVRAYAEAFRELDEGHPNAFDDFRTLSIEFPDDPLARLHWHRLQRGQLGSTIVLEEK
ncbi:adenylate/guanylate cyclase domain-containing protein [Lamprobacter modestohalophilus]|uniref:CHASE2 domain-containing protein n=1 Tax=Lamprobacter modestohalophilus TaxID=1064514 RepID=UPI002ADEAD8C|nr:adenylate/guanylate cyclase domain-containing protein [Lamprobacter modestohalophilus]MEA1051733.1 adenylate/guanylate cyclase domain-containing protein [Lamprobacter modestohalophilus]